MKKRIIAITLICAMLMGFGVQAATADTYFMATVDGTTVYSDTFSEVATEGAVVTLLKDVDGDITVGNNLQLELNGKSVKGTVTVAENVTLQVSDSATADYDVTDDKFGTIKVSGVGKVVGAAAGGNTYLKVENDGKLSFHAIDLDIDAMNMKIEKQGLYFDHTFKGDHVAKAQILSYGIIINKSREPVAEDFAAAPNPKNKTVVLGDGYAYTSFRGDFGGATSTLVTGIMKEENGWATNRKNAAAALRGKAYIQTAEGYFLGVNRQRSLRDQVEIADEKWVDVTDSQRKDLLRLYRNDSFNRVMKAWSVDNLKQYGQQVSTSNVTAADLTLLQSLYANKTAFHGEVHDHADTGGTSDGRQTLSTWVENMQQLKMDFAFILDHKQALHMDTEITPEWDDACFIGGSEAACTVKDRPAGSNNFHYDMVFTDKAAFERILLEFTEFGYHEYTSGDYAGQWHFGYPNFTAARLNELITRIKEEGGFFSIAHLSSSITIPEDITDLYYQDHMAYMVFYDTCGTARTSENYKIWTALLDAGKRVWASAGNDGHNFPSIQALSTVYADAIYSEETGKYSPENILNQVRVGNFAPGYAGIRMAIGDTVMGSTGSFKDQRLVFSVGDFFENKQDHTFTVSLVDDMGTVFTQQMTGNEMKTFAIDADENAKFYRVEVYDETDNMLIGLGNPIWNSEFYQD